MLIHQIKRSSIPVQTTAKEHRSEQQFDYFLESVPEKIKVLVLEPDHVYRDTLCRFARRRGASAIGCGSFLQFKNAWVANPPDVVIISFVINEKIKAPEILRLLGNVPVLIMKHPKIDVHTNFVWPDHLKKIVNRTDGAGAIIDDALMFAAEFRSEQILLSQTKTRRA